MPSRFERSQLKRYGTSIFLVCAAVVATIAIQPLFGGRAPLTAFTVAVILSASYGGLGPGLLATALSVAIVKLKFENSVFTLFRVQSTLGLFTFIGVAVTLVIERFRRANAQLEQAKDRLELANEELSRRTKALAQSNEELQRFAYGLSHDLQNPLRTVSVFTERLASHNEAGLDEHSRQSIAFILQGVHRMQEMIQGLLAYSTATNDEDQTNATDCNAVLAKVTEDLRGAIEESGASVTWDPLPIVEAHQARLHQVFLNLIGNAIKYRSDAKCDVHVSAKRNGGEWLFAVKDNGIGVDMQYADKIFGVFERLHGSGQYSGSGIGLAVCRAVIQRQGGRIWVESAPGKGSTFFFTISA